MWRLDVFRHLSRQHDNKLPFAQGRMGPMVPAATRVGRSPGRTIAALCTIERPPTLEAGRGPSENGWSGGMRTQRNGPASDTPDFVPRNGPICGRTGASIPRAWMRSVAMIRFIMEPDGKCQFFVPSGLKDGPLPTYYEPVESPVANALYPAADEPRGEAVAEARQRYA